MYNSSCPDCRRQGSACSKHEESDTDSIELPEIEIGGYDSSDSGSGSGE